ncbi:MAG: hypothetical protein L6R39_000391 [Caloplaca ligustica]|nr:MAG: hypothetical protein L6R39_000391 [Caloplaca ligustica]
MLFIRPPPSPFEPPSLPFRFISSPLQFFAQYLHYFFLLFRGSAFQPLDPSSAVRLVCISDTHGKETAIPDGDVLIHAGDLTSQGTAAEIQEQVDWIASLPHRYKVIVAGNHDSFFDPRSRHESDHDRAIDFKGIRYLQHSSVTLDFPGVKNRRLTFHGAPQIPACGGDDFAFQYSRHQDPWSGTIPHSTNVLVTHTPPRHHLDLPHGMGCKYLLKEVWAVKPKVHVFGHVHAGYGRESVFWDEGQKAYERVCARDRVGLLRDLVDTSAWLDTARVVWYGVQGVLWTQVWGGTGTSTLMINASLTYRSTGELVNAPQIVNV